jgi:Phage integrase SAM-like domain
LYREVTGTKQPKDKHLRDSYNALADKRKASNPDNWVSDYNYLETFTKGNLKFADLNEKFCNEFKKYLLTTKSNKSSKTTLSQIRQFPISTSLKQL